MGRATRAGRCLLPHAADLPLRALGLLSRQADHCGSRVGTGRGRPCADRRPAAHRQARARRHATPDNPIGAHLCADRSEIARIYSTSGTTGTPAYIPLTAGDLDNWVTGSARSYAASGIAAGQAIVSTYNAGPFVAGAVLAAFNRHRPLPHPCRHREYRAPASRAIELFAAAGPRPDTVVRAASRRVASRRGVDLARLGRRASPRAGRRAGGGRAPSARAAAIGLERPGHRDDGDRRHRRLPMG